ncbi:MAG: glycosyltransferase [Burkholderiales bacterium]|nr:glycosyltransferase [Burkholderiales bacterium]
MSSIRSVCFVCSLIVVFFAAALHWTHWAAMNRASVTLLSYGIMFIGFIGTWLCFPDGLSTSRKFGLILLISLIVRMPTMGVPVSDDVYRYLWEGKITAIGESPYRFPADHAYYDSHRDAYWEHMNHKDKFTVYPPLAELVFAAVGGIAYTPWMFKLVFVIVDLCVISVLIVLLKQYGMDVRNAIFYALNPLTLFAIAGEAHFDVLMILAIMLSLLNVEKRAYSWAWLWLSIAIQIKIVAIVLVPYYLWHCNWRYGWLLLVPLMLSSLVFLDTLPNMLQGLWAFGGMNAFNGPVHGVINYMLHGQVIWATGIVTVLYGLVALWTIRTVKNPLKAAYLLISALVFFLPVVHYWYILWILPFIALYPGLSWLVLSLTSGVYFTSLYSVEQGGTWHLPTWSMWVMWLPFLLVLVYELRFVAARRFRPDTPWPKPETLSVLVPTLNEQDQIRNCLLAAKSLLPRAEEIIVCDGGSTDQTVAIAKQLGARVVATRPGRGTQIRKGVEVSHSDVALVVHADCVCDGNVSQKIMNVLARNPDVVGGAVGQRFATSNMRLLIIEMLNDARATLGGASFGDQGQFFRTAAIKKIGGYPDYPLMEDVELSLRMQKIGRTVLLDSGICNSARQWQQGFIKRIWLIIKLVTVFRLNRMLRRDVTQKLYAIYYGRK